MDNPQYAEYVRLLKALHRRMAEGKDDDEADALRDEMDAPWYALSEEEIARVQVLSGDLYTLEEEEKPADGMDVGAVRIDLVRAWGAHDWDTLLNLLHRYPGVLASHEAAFRRGWCWSELGDPDTAALFFQRAAELDPRNVKYPIAVMVAHVRAGHIDAALRYARTILDPPGQNVA
jgi:hypothetical protein